MGTPKQHEPIRATAIPEPEGQPKECTGQSAEEMELKAEVLEDRIVPKLASNSNETFLLDR